MDRQAAPRGAALRQGAAVLRAALGQGDAQRLGAALLLALAAACLAAAAPVAFKYLVDAVALAQPPGPILPVTALLAAYVLALGLGRLAGEARTFLFGAAEQSVSRNLARAAFSHILRLPMKYHAGRSTGATVQTLENGLQGYRLVLQHGLFTVLPGVAEILLIGFLVVQFFDAGLLAVFAACTAAYIAVFADGARRVLRASQAVSAARIEAGARLSDGLLNIETVKAFGGEDVVTGRYDARLAETEAVWRVFYRVRFINGLLVALVFSAGLAATLGLAAAGPAARSLTPGDLVLVNAWMLQVARPLELLGYAVRDIGQGAAFVERLNLLLREPPEDAGGSVHVASSGGPVSVRFENVSFSHEPGRKVLDNISFEIAAGTTTALVGPSGSGKSTILRLLMRLCEPDEGRILIGGVPAADYPLGQLRQMIAPVMQDNSLFNESLGFNIAFPDAGKGEAYIEEAVRMANLGDLLSRLPRGAGTIVGERGLMLSGGEKQRVAIARALRRRAPIFVADEATSALDARTEAHSVCGAFSAYEATTIVVTHRLAIAVHSDQVLVFDTGHIVERGSHASLIAAGGTYYDLWRLQQAE